MEKILEIIGSIIVGLILGLIAIIETILKLIAFIAIIPVVIFLHLFVPIFRNCDFKFIQIWNSYATNWQYWPVYFKFKKWYNIW
jgi:hypothetical protein